MVLILVLVEDGLREIPKMTLEEFCDSLNPCFSGGWSQRPPSRIKKVRSITVLILVLVEDGLRV